MKPIVLTRLFDSGRTTRVYINPEQVAFFQADWSETYVYLAGVNDVVLRVSETPAEIETALEIHRSRLRIEDRDGVRVIMTPEREWAS